MGTDNGPGKWPAILPIEASPSSERTGLLGDDTLYKLGMFRLAGRTSEECKDLKFAPEKDGAVDALCSQTRRPRPKLDLTIEKVCKHDACAIQQCLARSTHQQQRCIDAEINAWKRGSDRVKAVHAAKEPLLPQSA